MKGNYHHISYLFAIQNLVNNVAMMYAGESTVTQPCPNEFVQAGMMP